MVARRTRFDVVRVVGPQAGSYLEGQLSQNVETLDVGDCRWSLLLQPQGHMVALFRVVRTAPEAFSFIADPGAGSSIAARLERFKLGTQAEIESSTCEAVSVRSAEPTDLPAGPVTHDGELAYVPLLWPELPGVDVFGAAVERVAPEGDPDLIEALRIGAGVPVFGVDYDDRTVPASLGVVDISVDFTKGCYTGQELVARMDSRGNNAPRKLRVLSAVGAAPAVGAEGFVDGGGDPVAELTSVASISNGWVALASVKRAALEVAEFHVGGTVAVVQP